MDQLKEILRQAIKYRFWIAVGVSALLPVIAYFLGAGAIQLQAETQANIITAADKDVIQYSSGVPVNKDYKPLVSEKTEVLTQDVQNTWKKLYNSQKDLLKWPDTVHERFTKWGRAWPDPTVADASAVHAAIIDYIEAYPKVVTDVYKSCNPFDPETGKGVVAAPPEDGLLRPAKYDQSKPPSLGKVWGDQERLWVQRALLEVVAAVNKSAKDWDGAIIKQINIVNVGSASAQDQRSIAKGEQPEKAPDVDDPNKPAAAADSTAGGDNSPMASMAMYAKSMGGMGMGGSGGGQTEDVYYIHTDSSQFKIMPVQLSVQIEQSRIQDLLVALENSPMNVQVMDFEMGRPQARVTKPEKGSNMMGMMGMYGGNQMGEMMMRGYMKGMSGFGGNFSRSMMGAGEMSGMYSSMMGGMGGMGAAAPERKGKDIRSEDLAKKRREQEKAVKSVNVSALHDPYFNIVEVTIYGQARFFNPPPPEPATEPSQSEAAGAEAAPKADAPKTEAAPKAEAPKTEAPKAGAAPKADAPKAGAAPKADAPRAEVPKTEAPKAEVPKAGAGVPKF
jgi:hypothetical protein